MFKKIKERLKKIPWIYSLNAFLKAGSNTRKTKKTLRLLQEESGRFKFKIF